MNKDMTIFLELAAKTDKFRQGMHEGEQSLEGFRQYAQKVGRTVQVLTQEIGFLGNAAAALSSGVVLKKLFSVTDYMPVDDALLRMRAEFKNTAEEMNAFKKQLTSLAGETGEDQGKIFQMAYRLSLSYKPEDITEIIKQSDRISDATKQPIESSQEALTRIMKLYKLTGKEAREAADNLIASRVDLTQFDSIIQRISMRSGSKNDYVEQLAFIRGLKGAGYDTTKVVNALNDVMGKIDENGALLNANGIKVFSIDDQGNKVWEKKINVLKDLDAYLQKVSKTTSESKIKERFDQVFGPEGLEKIKALIKQIPALEKGIKEMGNARQIAAERAEAAEDTWEKRLGQIKSHLGGIKNDLSFIFDLAKKPVRFFAENENLTKAAGYTAAGVSFAVLAALGYGNLKNILGKLGKSGAGVVKGQLLQEVAGVTPVFVVNMPAGGIIPGGTLPDTTAKTGIMASIAAWLKSYAPVVVVGTTAVVADAYLGKGGSVDNLGSAVHGMPETGSPDDAWIEKIINYFSPSTKPEIKNSINITLNVDKNGRMIASTDNSNTDWLIELNRGTSFVAGAAPIGALDYRR